MTTPTPEQIAARAARQAARKAAMEEARRQRVLTRMALAEELAVARRERQALRRRTPMDMTGWVTLTGEALPADEGGVTLGLTKGFVATKDPAVGGVITPAVTVVPGLTYVVAATTGGIRIFVGLQWVNQDGTPNMSILWVKGPGRVTVSGVAPETARGVRALLACYSVAAADLLGKDTPTKVTQQNLRAWIIANPGAGEA